MRIIKFATFFFVLMMIGQVSAIAQESQKKAKKPKYSAKLAKKVGADKNGMRQYVVAFLKTGPRDGDFEGDERAALFRGHFANMKRLAAEGRLAVAGPFSDPEKKFRGLFILAVTTVEEARKLAETDPVVKSGLMVVEYVPWFGSAALMLSNELHYKVQKESM